MDAFEAPVTYQQRFKLGPVMPRMGSLTIANQVLHLSDSSGGSDISVPFSDIKYVTKLITSQRGTRGFELILSNGSQYRVQFLGGFGNALQQIGSQGVGGMLRQLSQDSPVSVTSSFNMPGATDDQEFWQIMRQANLSKPRIRNPLGAARMVAYIAVIAIIVITLMRM